MALVRFSKEELDVEVTQEISVLTLALNQKIPMTHSCGAELKCATCKIRVLDGMMGLSNPSTAEIRMLEQNRFPDFIRLGCQARIQPEYTGVIEIGTIIKNHGKTFTPKVPAKFRR
ncbi:MAG: (2Fe-2S)-binding protein [Candidatus Cloacimonetes bacterium]|nr:(2Fe-2S)-binding protein [Candidatus Cloacimonadota bacterium]